jgi:hypothetical protein
MNGARISMNKCLGIAVCMLLSFKETDRQPIVSEDFSTETEVTQNVVKGIVMTDHGISLLGATVKTTTIYNALIKQI